VALLTDSNLVITIQEANAGLSWSPAALSKAEPAGTGTNTVVLTMVRTGNTNQTTTVEWTTSNGVALAESDYNAQNGTLTFLAGVTSNSVTIEILGDGSPEGNQPFGLTMSNPSAATILLNTNATITVLDCDATFAFAAATASIVEPSNSVVLTVLRSGSTNSLMTVDFAAIGVTATAGSDFTATNGTLSFAAGATSQTLRVYITNDTAVESNETFTVVLTNASQGVVVSGATSNCTVTIVDNDARLTWALTNLTLIESNGTVALTVYRSGTTNVTNTVSYTFVAGSAIFGQPDYKAVIDAMRAELAR
jgi:hypothetical protein